MVRLQIGAVTCCAMLAGLLLPAASPAAGRDVPRTTVLTGAGLKVTWPLPSGSAVVAPGTTLSVEVRPTSAARNRIARIALARLDAAGRTVAVVKTATVRRGTFTVRVPRRAGARYALTLRAGPLRRTGRFRTPAPVRPAPAAPGVAVDAREDALPIEASASTPASEAPTEPQRVEEPPVETPAAEEPSAEPEDEPADPADGEDAVPAPSDEPAPTPSLPAPGGGCLFSGPAPTDPSAPWSSSGAPGYLPSPLVALRFGSSSAPAGSSVAYTIESLGTTGISFAAGYRWQRLVAGAWVAAPPYLFFPTIMLGVAPGDSWTSTAGTATTPGRYRLLIGGVSMPGCAKLAAEIDLVAPAP